MQKAPGEEAGGLALAAARDAEKDDLVIQEAVTIEDPKIEACVRKNSEESSTQWTTGIAEVQPPINVHRPWRHTLSGGWGGRFLIPTKGRV
uniref:Uncharacterized protein n=1 Tax=Oryza meridionalis TaxID=40149 RepID=A0A0E0CH18_9ORYZ